MNNKKLKGLRNIFLTSITIALIICALVTSGIASSIDNAYSVGDYIRATRDASWYDFNPSSIIGKDAHSYDRNGNGDSSFLLAGGYCIEPNHQYNYNGVYKVVNIIDINVDKSNTSSNTVKIYGYNSNGAKTENEIPFSDSRVKPVLELAYMTMMGNDVTNTTSTYKDAMARLMWSKSNVNTMHEIGLSDYINGQYWSDTTNPNATIKGIFNLAEDAANKWAAQGSGAIVDKTNVNDITVDTVDGKFYIGPYKLGLTGGCKVGEITVNDTEKAIGIATEIGNVKGVDSVVNEKEFYIVLDKEISEIKTIKVKSQNAINSVKARLMIFGGGISQNFLVYNAQPYTESVEVSLKVPEFGKINIEKQDEFPEASLQLEGITFKLYRQDKKQWVKVEDGKVVYTDNINEAEELIVGRKTNGVFKTPTLEKLPLGKYSIYETYIPERLNIYYDLNETTLADGTKLSDGVKVKLFKKDVEVKSGQTITVKGTNIRDFTNFYIRKVDSDTKIRMAGVGFKLYKKDSGWVVFGEDTIVTSVTEQDKEKASILKTQDNGTTQTLMKLPLGTYEIHEVDLGQNSLYYDLGEIVVDGKSYNEENPYQVEIKASQGGGMRAELENKQKYIRITGSVWEDIAQGKTYAAFNDELNEDDIRLDGIEVRLMKKNADGTVTVEQTKKTGSVYDIATHGAYEFTRVRIEDLPNYYVEFEYDGMTYQSLLKGEPTNDAASKADEDSEDRMSLNNAFTEVTGEGQTVYYNGNTITLSYSEDFPDDTTKEPTVRLNNTCDREEKYKLTGSKGFMQLQKLGDFPVDSRISDNYLIDRYNVLKAQENRSGRIVKTISNVNLGVYKRVRPDLALKTEIVKAMVTINGVSYDYNNQSNGNPELSTWPTGASFERRDPGPNDPLYKAPIYLADAKYENADKSKELKVYVTYKIAVTNNDKSLYSKVNAITEGYSKEFTFDRAYMLDSNNNEVIISRKTREADANQNYKTITLGKIGTIEPETSKYLYVVLEIDRDEIYHDGKVDESKIYRNWAEISSYTTLTKDQEVYAAVDIDSIPNNGTIPARHEDDEDWATGLQLVNSVDRDGSGIVFLDNIVTETGAGKERLGNGVLDSTDKGISNVKVELIRKSDNEVVQQTTTNENGEYVLDGFISGDYLIRFTWGEGQGSKLADGTQITVDDYKSTIWKNTSQNSNAGWHVQDSQRLSDALDDWELRTKLDKENASLKELLSKPTNETNSGAVMYSTTRDFHAEFEDRVGKGLVYDENNSYVPSDIFVIKNVDFGIVERPRQSVDIEKHVESLKVITDAGQSLVEAAIKDGKLDVTAGIVTGGPEFGFVKCEIDTDLVKSGTKAQVGYAITVKNTSEVDYDSESYYKYATKTGNKVTLTIDGVYDYLSGISADVDKVKENWEILNKGSRNQETITTSLFESCYNAYRFGNTEWYEQTTEGGKKFVSETIGEKMSGALMVWEIDELVSVKDIQSAFQNGNEISKLARTVTLEPGASEDIKYNASTLLKTTGEIRFDNAVEIADVIRNGKTGRNVTTEISKFYDRSEWVTITPPTGADKDYAPIVITTVSAIALLGVGIILIKKIVLK